MVALVLTGALAAEAIDFEVTTGAEPTFFGQETTLDSLVPTTGQPVPPSSVVPEFYADGEAPVRDEGNGGVVGPPVPEPMSLASMGIGLAALMLRRRRK